MLDELCTRFVHVCSFYSCTLLTFMLISCISHYPLYVSVPVVINENINKAPAWKSAMIYYAIGVSNVIWLVDLTLCTVCSKCYHDIHTFTSWRCFPFCIHLTGTYRGILSTKNTIPRITAICSSGPKHC